VNVLNLVYVHFSAVKVIHIQAGSKLCSCNFISCVFCIYCLLFDALILKPVFLLSGAHMYKVVIVLNNNTFTFRAFGRALELAHGV